MLFRSPIALKATSSREALPSKVAQVEAARLNEDEMALIIKRFKTALKGRKEYPNNTTKIPPLLQHFYALLEVEISVAKGYTNA